MWFIAASVGLSLLVLYLLKRRREFVSLVDRVPGPKGWPVLGNVAHIGAFVDDTPTVPRLAIALERFKGLNELYGKKGLYKIWIASMPYFFVSNYKNFEKILSSNSNLGKSRDYTLFNSWLGTGLLTGSGAKWKSRRKLLTPTFHFRILEDFLGVINEQSKIFTRVLKSTLTQEQTDIVPLLTRYTLDIICETAMGVSIDAQNNQDSDYLSNLHHVTRLLMDRAPRVWLWPDSIYNFTANGKQYAGYLKYLHDFTLKVIREKKTCFQKFDLSDEGKGGFQKARRRLAFLDILLNEHFSNPDFLEEHVREEVDTFMFEGHDTTAMGLSWALYLIGHAPDVQKKICEELESIFGDDVDRDVTSDDLKEMKYMECAIKEALRLFPPVPYVGRTITEDVQIDGYTIPKGSQLFVLLYVGHRDPEVFPQPEVFNPDNFLPENSSERNTFAHLPFSAGPRNCIGQKFALMEEKVTLANVFRNFTIESLDPRDKVVVSGEVVLRPVGGIRMRIRERKTNPMEI